jgi:hypothetical protein
MSPTIIELHRRDQHALLEHFGGLAVGAAGDHAADIRLVRDAAGESDECILMKDRRDDGEIRGVRQIALVGMIAQQEVAIRQRAAMHLEDAADKMEIDRRMQDHRRRHRNAAAAVGNDAGEIARLADDGRIAGAEEMIVHLLHQACDPVAQKLHRDAVDRLTHRSPPG